MIDFDINIFEDEEPDGIAEKIRRKDRRVYYIPDEIRNLESLIHTPPMQGEVIKMISLGGFASIGVISFVAEFEPIEELHVSTFRVGRKQFETLCELYNDGRLNNVDIVTSATQTRTDRQARYKDSEYNYFDEIKETCESNGWGLTVYDNHSKLILMRTANNYYVVETSSNLNENPKIEQFSFENDKTLYDFYAGFFEKLKKYAGD